MGLDRAPIEFKTFYFFHVWLEPPKQHLYDKKDPESTENEEDAKNKGEGDYACEVEQGGQG